MENIEETENNTANIETEEIKNDNNEHTEQSEINKIEPIQEKKAEDEQPQPEETKEADKEEVKAVKPRAKIYKPADETPITPKNSKPAQEKSVVKTNSSKNLIDEVVRRLTRQKSKKEATMPKEHTFKPKINEGSETMEKFMEWADKDVLTRLQRDPTNPLASQFNKPVDMSKYNLVTGRPSIKPYKKASDTLKQRLSTPSIERLNGYKKEQEQRMAKLRELDAAKNLQGNTQDIWDGKAPEKPDKPADLKQVAGLSLSVDDWSSRRQKQQEDWEKEHIEGKCTFKPENSKVYGIKKSAYNDWKQSFKQKIEQEANPFDRTKLKIFNEHTKNGMDKREDLKALQEKFVPDYFKEKSEELWNKHKVKDLVFKPQPMKKRAKTPVDMESRVKEFYEGKNHDWIQFKANDNPECPSNRKKVLDNQQPWQLNSVLRVLKTNENHFSGNDPMLNSTRSLKELSKTMN